MEDADDIEAHHVARAIEQLGNSYLLGLDTSQKAIPGEYLARKRLYSLKRGKHGIAGHAAGSGAI